MIPGHHEERRGRTMMTGTDHFASLLVDYFTSLLLHRLGLVICLGLGLATYEFSYQEV